MEFIPSSLHKPALIKETVRKLKRFWEFTGIPDKIFISVRNISHQTSTKCSLVSDIARTFDVLGWGITNNTTHEDTVPAFLEFEVRLGSRSSSRTTRATSTLEGTTEPIQNISLSRCYHRSNDTLTSQELHRFSDVSKQAMQL